MFDVRDYSAVADPGDESTDSARSIDAAVNAAGDAGGGVVLVPDGTYVLGTVSARPGSIHSFIVPRDNVTIRMSRNVVLKVKTDRNASVPWNIIYSSNLVTNFRVIGGTIDGGRNALRPGDAERSNTFVGSSGGGHRIHIYGVTFRNMPGNNPVAFSGTAGTRGEIIVEKCRFLDGGSGMPGNTSADHSSIYLLGSNNKVIDNYFKSAGQVAGAAWENHGIDFEAYGNYVNGYNQAFWITSETGNCRTSKTHDNIFDNVYSGGGFGSGNNNGFGKVDYYNNTVTLHPSAMPPNAYYLLYGPDTIFDTADEWNVHDNRFYGNGKAVHLVSGIGAKIFRFHNNHAEGFGGYGYLQSTSATFDNTYSNHLVDIHGNTFRNFTAAQPVVSFGGAVKRLDIRDNRILHDNTIALTAVYLRTKAGGGRFEGNFIDNTYDTDIDFGRGMAKVHVNHELRNGFDRTANYAAIGSRVEDPRYNRTFAKRTVDGSWHATSVGSGPPSNWRDAKVGDLVFNSGTGDVLGWKCAVGGAPGGWKEIRRTRDP